MLSTKMVEKHGLRHDDRRRTPRSPGDQEEGNSRPTEALLAEFAFITDGIRQDQRERLAILGFTLAANSAILGLLAHQATNRLSASQALILLGIALAIIFVADVMTIRATIGVASAGHYLRLFVEPKVPGLYFQTRHPRFLEALRWQGRFVPGTFIRSSVHTASGLAVAYGVLAAGLVGTWFSVDVSTHHESWQDAIVIVAGCVNFTLAAGLWWTAHKGARRIGQAWEDVAKEKLCGSLSGDSGVGAPDSPADN
jgi:hypothetical protein